MIEIGPIKVRSDEPMGEIHLDRGDGTMIEIGPIKVRSDEPMEEIHGRTLDWLKEHHPEVAASAPHGVVLYIGDAPAPASSELFTATPGSIFLKRAEPWRQSLPRCLALGGAREACPYLVSDGGRIG